MDPIAPPTRTIRPIIKSANSQSLSTDITPGPSPTMKAVKKLRFTDLPSSDLSDAEHYISAIPLSENPTLSHPESDISRKNKSSYCEKSKILIVTQANVKNTEGSLNENKHFQDDLKNKDCFKLFDTLETESKESCGFLKEVTKNLKYLKFRNECVKLKESFIKDEKLRSERVFESELDREMFCENKKLPNCTSQCRIF